MTPAQSSPNTIIIAEAGENHCGDMEMAHRLIEVAAKAGADFVKFQLYDAAKVANDDPERDWFKKVQVSDAQFMDLVRHARKHDILPLCTPWAIDKAELIFSAGIDAMKIASFHTVDMELLRYVNERAVTVFISTGMTSLQETDRAVEALGRVKNLYVLHCVSEYPLPPEHVNLRVMDTLRERYGRRARIGYSDHTTGIFAPVMSVAHGAEVIEKHITLSHHLPGTDHVLSADPDELMELVRQIRAVETLLGRDEKMLTAVESQLQETMRNRFRH